MPRKQIILKRTKVKYLMNYLVLLVIKYYYCVMYCAKKTIEQIPIARRSFSNILFVVIQLIVTFWDVLSSIRKCIQRYKKKIPIIQTSHFTE